MKIAKTVAIAGTVIMFFTLAYGFIQGDFFGEGSLLMSIAWGKVSLVDVYVGFLLFSGWVVYRENDWLNSFLWVLAILLLGNLLACAYTTNALFRANNDWRKFWLGKRNY